MNVGDYVRFYDRSWVEIGQIVGEVEDSHLKVVKCRDGYYDLDGFIKSSPNLIDILQAGDYVNGERVINIIKKHKYLEVSDEEIIIDEKDIKTIVTKEMFKQMEYKIQ